MNARKSLVWWIVFIAYYVGVFLAFAKGAGLTETDGTKGAIWMGGAIVAAALGVFAAIKLNKAR
jgi:hypothetical protein